MLHAQMSRLLAQMLRPNRSVNRSWMRSASDSPSALPPRSPSQESAAPSSTDFIDLDDNRAS